MNGDYQNFFTLREKYPKLKNLIAELLAAFFKNGDSFPPKFYIFGTYNQSDVATVLKDFGLPNNICTNCINIRKSNYTLISID